MILHSRTCRFLGLSTLIMGNTLFFSCFGATNAEAGFWQGLQRWKKWLGGGERESLPLSKELSGLRQAYIFADKSISGPEMEKELVEELDQSIAESWWSKDQGHPTDKYSNPEKMKKEYLQGLSDEEKERLRDNEFRNNSKYVPSTLPGSSLRSFEVWKRSNARAHEAILKDLTLKPSQLKKGYRMSYHLPEKDVPFGGNYFPDNLGGITRRWNNKDFFWDELFAYKTFHEMARGQIDAATMKRIRELMKTDRQGYATFKEKCRRELPTLTMVKCYQKIHGEWTQVVTKRIVTAKLRRLTQRQLNALSPTEKYDIANGYYDFRTTEFEKYYKGKHRKSFTRKHPFISSLLFGLSWEGRCNADRACGICERHNEPVHQLTVDVEEIGKKIVFRPLDIKALFMSTFFYVENYAMLGRRSGNHERENNVPPNMAAFDALLRGAFTRNHLPFVIDNRNKGPVNNVTVIGYDRMVKSVRPITAVEKNSLKRRLKLAQEGKLEKSMLPENFGDGKDDGSFQNEMELFKRVGQATKVARIKTRLTVLSEVPVDKADGPTKAMIARHGKFTKKEDVEYDLYLDENNRIVEGKYLSGNIDFVWFADGKGMEEHQEKGNKLIKYDLMKDLARKSSSAAQKIERKAFPGQN